MNENKKAEINIHVEGNDISVQIDSGSRDVIRGTAAFIHNIAQVMGMHPLEVIIELAGEVEAIDGHLNVETIHDFSVIQSEEANDER